MRGLGSAILLWWLLSQPTGASPASRVILVSFDGLGYEIFRSDPAARELTALHRLARRGVTGPVRPAHPSTTANSHAALWTGSYQNGVLYNSNPEMPKSEHTFRERRTGFRSESLAAEPLWVSAGRQGVATVAHQVTQGFPFLPVNTAPEAAAPPVVINGYQTERLAPHTVIRAADVRWGACSGWQPALPEHARCFEWTSGRLTFHGALSAGEKESVLVALDPGGPRAAVRHAPEEPFFGGARSLARHFSKPLMVNERAAVAFRLFEFSPSAPDFVLYQTTVQELGYHDARDPNAARRLAAEAGPFVPNGPVQIYRSGGFGSTAVEGGSGVAERRYLEAVEYLTRQYNRYTRSLWERYAPRLFIDYFPYPDEADHTWLGLAVQPDDKLPAGALTTIREARRAAYRLINERLALFASLAGDSVDLIVTSDHGMAPAAKLVHVNLALRQAGLERHAEHLRYCILLNSEEWAGGTVSAGERDAVLDRVQGALEAIRDPATGERVVRGIRRLDAPAAMPGADLLFDLAPGYAAGDASSGPVVESAPWPFGTHGFAPDRDDMQAVFVAAGPGFAAGESRPMRSIDVAPLIARLLGIDPPRHAEARPAQGP
jgi:predicted AlkP superfamily phosphohydrolase/phosphomutase